MICDGYPQEVQGVWWLSLAGSIAVALFDDADLEVGITDGKLAITVTLVDGYHRFLAWVDLCEEGER